MNLQIPKDAFSDGQVRSKLWLAENLGQWNQKYLNSSMNYIMTWYGSWVGVGPFLVLSLTQLKLSALNLVELDQDALRNSAQILDHWFIEGLKINLINSDMNTFNPEASENQIFINTACEHLLEMDWLARIPKNSYVLLQSTNMIHDEHINCPTDLDHFKNIYSPHLKILELAQLDFSYPTKSFSRYMLFGQKC